MKFRVGDLVWAKTDKDMMWPAKILQVEKGHQYKVGFLNDTIETYLDEKALTDYAKNKAKYQHALSTRKFKEAVHLAEKKLEVKKEKVPVEVKKGRSGSNSPMANKRKRPPSAEEAVAAPELKDSGEKVDQGRKKLKKSSKQQHPAAMEVHKHSEHQQSDHIQSHHSKAQTFGPVPYPQPTQQQVQLPPRFAALSEIRVRVNGLLLQLSMQPKSQPATLCPSSTTALCQIPILLQDFQLRVQDLLVNHLSSALYYLTRRLHKNHQRITRMITDELRILQLKLVEKWENTDVLETEYQAMRMERARTMVSDDQ